MGGWWKTNQPKNKKNQASVDDGDLIPAGRDTQCCSSLAVSYKARPPVGRRLPHSPVPSHVDFNLFQKFKEYLGPGSRIQTLH